MKKNRPRRPVWLTFAGICLSAWCTSSSIAYEIDTHARISQKAFESSTLQTAETLRRLGLTKSRKVGPGGASNQPWLISLGTTYYEVTGSTVVSRSAKRFDQVKSPVGVFLNDPTIDRWGFSAFNNQPVPYFPVDWLARGAVREDDQSNALVALENRAIATPLGLVQWSGDANAYDQLDANPNINRFCNHFYDPLNDRALVLPAPLSWAACGSGQVLGSSIAWSLGRDPALPNGSGGPHANRANHFTILDASEAMWRALTGTDNQGAVVALARTQRDAYWATTFRSLGSVVHNLQDAGQPQHTRNEAHPFGGAHLLEERVNAAATGAGARGATIDATVDEPPPLIYSGYTKPMFTRYRDFFSTGSGLSPAFGTSSAKGLANYSNRGFFTYQSNIGNTTYPEPVSGTAGYGQVIEGNGGGFDEIYLSSDVPDNYTGVRSTPIKMARAGLLQDVIELYAPGLGAGTYSYSIDWRVIDDQAKLLIPRAVGYSAGMIDFFFRGSLAIAPTTDGIFGVMDHASGTGFTKLILKVKNTTAAINDPVNNAAVPQQMSPGKFVAVVRFHRDLAFSNDLSAAIGLGACNNLSAVYGAGNEPTVVGHDPTRSTACRDGNETMVTSVQRIETLDPDEEKEMSFDFSASPIPLAGVDYSVQVVYRGKLGVEDDAVATGFRDMADPMFITRHNMYDYIMHGVSDSLNNNEFGATIPSAEFPGPVNFYRANWHLYDFGYTSDLKGLNISGWSFFGMEPFTAYDYTRSVSYQYTFGPRNVASVATATTVPAGGFTRIAVLVPLWKPNGVAETPPVRIERQRLVESAYMGETVDLLRPQRHQSQQVPWLAPMRGVNSWHSDGYVWYRPQLKGFFDASTHFWQYCKVGARAELLGTVRDYDPLSLDLTNNQHLVYEIGLRLTGSGDVFWRQNGPPPSYEVDTQDRGQICTASSRSRLVPPPAASETAALGVTFTYSTGFWGSSYSPWDVLISTNGVSPFENPSATNDYLYPEAVELPLATSPKLSLDGITQTAILGKAPTPVTIAQKYR